MISEEDKKFHAKWGYEQLEVVHNELCALQRFMFTWGVIIGLTRATIRGRYCFDTKQNAELFYKEYIATSGCIIPIVGIDGCTAIKI